MRMLTRIGRLLVFASCFCLPATVFAQASITGTVKDASGAVLPGVTVEASSPALIEKVRTVVTDGTGQYRVVDLRPGIYAVKFSLAGFKTFDRSGVELTGSFTALVNAELTVGALEETVTVSGETPIVNVQSATKEANLTKEIIDAIPTSRMTHTLAVLLPGVSTAGGTQMMAGSQDVGGDRGGTAMLLAIHGSRGVDNLYRLNGIAVNSNRTTTPFNVAAMQEVSIETSAVSAEEPSGGIRVNMIPRDGGNTFAGSFFGSYVNEHIQSDNYTDDLKARGLLAPNKIKGQYDINPGYGGPLSRDRLWFFGSVRYLVVDRYAPGLPFNRNAYLPFDDPKGFIYAPDASLGSPTTYNRWVDGGARLTWQMTAKHKLAGAFADQFSDNPHSFSGAISTSQPLVISPETSLWNHRPYYRYATADWTSPLTSRLLVESHMYLWWYHGGFFRNNDPLQDARVIGVDDSVTGIKYRNWNSGGSADTWMTEQKWKTQVSYVTGAHQFQVGFQYLHGRNDGYTNGWNDVQYQFANGVPTRINLSAAPTASAQDRDAEVGLYGGDKWTMGHLTLSGAARFDYLKSSFPDVLQPPGTLFPSRTNVVVPGGPSASWKDLTWRMAAVHDVFGDGRTAVRVSLNKYIESSGNGGGLSNPNAFVAATFRAWTDNGANGGIAGDYVPQCNILATAANGECGALSNPLFGQVVPGTNIDPALRVGWNNRVYNWEFTTGVQREIASGLSLDVGYFRRWYGNFTVSTNLAVGPSDYDAFSIIVPPGLPNSGATVSGFVNLKPTSFGRPSNTFVTFADNYGNQTEHYNGIDVNVIARLAKVQLSGGFSTGRTSTDVCGLWAARPDLQTDSTGANSGTLNPSQYCHVDPMFLTQVKGFATYTVPVVDLQISAAVQSLFGPVLQAQYSATNADVAPSLGRPLTGGATALVQVITPGQFYGDHLNQLDLRFARTIRAGATRLTPSVDLFNAFNGNAVQQIISAYGSWNRPLVINQARFVKFSLNVNF